MDLCLARRGGGGGGGGLRLGALGWARLGGCAVEQHLQPLEELLPPQQHLLEPDGRRHLGGARDDEVVVTVRVGLGLIGRVDLLARRCRRREGRGLSKLLPLLLGQGEAVRGGMRQQRAVVRRAPPRRWERAARRVDAAEHLLELRWQPKRRATLSGLLTHHVHTFVLARRAVGERAQPHQLAQRRQRGATQRALELVVLQ